jgi:putative endonuclease
MEHTYFTYILASRRNGALYIGVTNDLARRVFEHKEGLGSAFTRKYGIKMLVYYEGYGEIGAAIAREKAMKQWLRKWKLELIERENPTWRDLSENFLK